MKKQARLTLWLLVIVFAVLVSGWLVWRNTISADTMNGPTILPIGAKTVEVGNVMIPVYVADRLEKTPDKAQLWVNWGDGTAASNVVPANTAPLTTVSFGQFAYVARIGHSYQNVGTYRLTLIPISSNGRRGQMVSVSITLTIGNNYNHSLDWLPSVNKISDGFVVGTNKAFNFQVNVHDKDGMNQSTLTSAIIMDWGDGTTTAPTSVVQGGTAGRDYTIRFENKQYARTLAYRPTLVIKEVNGAGVTKTVREQYVIVASEYQHAPYVNLDITSQGTKNTIKAGEEAKLVFSVNDWDGSDLKGSIDWGDGSTPTTFPANSGWIKAGDAGDLFATGGAYDSTRRIGYLRTNSIMPEHFGGVAAMPKHQYTKVGTYTAVISVEDSDSRKGSRSVPITVNGTAVNVFSDNFNDSVMLTEDYGRAPIGWHTPLIMALPYTVPASVSLDTRLQKTFASNYQAIVFNLFRNPVPTFTANATDFNLDANRDSVKAEFDFVVNNGTPGGEVRFGLGHAVAGFAGLTVKLNEANKLRLSSFSQRESDLNSSRNLSRDLTIQNRGDGPYNIGDEMSLTTPIHASLVLQRINNKPTMTVTLSGGGMIQEHSTGITFDGLSASDGSLLTTPGIYSFVISNYSDGSNETSFITGTIDNVAVTAQKATP